MKIFCKYHPTKPARWGCQKCGTNYCSDCVTPVIREFFGTKQPYYMCPKCNIDLVSLGVANTIIPFWLKLHKFFTYPLHPTPLFLVLAFSLGNSVFPEGGAFNTLIRAGIWGLLIKYAYAVLTNTAQGRLKPPGINSETICKDFLTVFKQSLLFLVIVIGAIVVIQKAGIWLGFLFLVFAILLIPAMIIVLVVNNSLLQAINPMVIVGTALQIGWSYFLMYFFLLLQFGGPAALTRYGVQYLPSHVARFILEFAGGFFTIASYHLMGYVVFQYHEKLGYPVDDSEDLLQAATASAKNAGIQILDQVELSIKDGKIPEAISIIRNRTNGAITDLNLSERYYDLLKIDQRTEEALEHAKGYLDLLVKGNNREKACDIYKECLSTDPEFVPGPSALFAIASWIRENGDVKGAIKAYDRFTKTHPSSPLIPKAYFLAAQIVAESLHNQRQAAAILETVVKHYPNHDIIPHVKAYARKINSHPASVAGA